MNAEESITLVLREELRKETSRFEKLKGGRNSQVFRVECGDGSVFAAKAYFKSERDSRDRLAAEYHALEFLKSAGVAQVAAPVAGSPSRQVGIYEFMAGKPLMAGCAGEREIDAAVEFLRVLKSVSADALQGAFPPASEACFSISAILRSVDGRLARLAKSSADQPELESFLQDELLPFRKAVGQWSADHCERHGIAMDGEISHADRILSPSDFGFHNALKQEDGTLVFLDFEYFGWDDPAKTVADFLLHPAMDLSAGLKQRFFAGAVDAGARGFVASLPARVEAVYPLFGLKWCAILLNEFTLEHMARRCFADATPGAWDGSIQIEKARRLLAGLLHDYRDFPYHS